MPGTPPAVDVVPADLAIYIEKDARRLRLLRDGHAELECPVVIGRNTLADKQVEGDEATPIGEFYVWAKNPQSRFFLSLALSYPNAEDAARGLAAGLVSAAEHRLILDAIAARKMPPQHTRLGGEIYIHGSGAGSAGTRGCIALHDAAMLRLYERVVLGTPVFISP